MPRKWLLTNLRCNTVQYLSILTSLWKSSNNLEMHIVVHICIHEDETGERIHGFCMLCHWSDRKYSNFFELRYTISFGKKNRISHLTISWKASQQIFRNTFSLLTDRHPFVFTRKTILLLYFYPRTNIFAPLIDYRLVQCSYLNHSYHKSRELSIDVGQNFVFHWESDETNGIKNGANVFSKIRVTIFESEYVAVNKKKNEEVLRWDV